MTQTNEYCVVRSEDVNEFVEMMRIEEEPPIIDEIWPIKTFVEYEIVTDFQSFEILQNIIIDINKQLLCSNGQTKVGQMYDELQPLFETFQRNVNKLALNVKRKIFIHLRQMTLHDMFKQ